MLSLVLLALAAWLVVLLFPGRPWSTREQLRTDAGLADLAEITVLIPARNESDVIESTLRALARQGKRLTVIVVDDRSADDTGDRARSLRAPTLAVSVVNGTPLPVGWMGKLWALQQGLDRVASRYVLLLDADIALAPGVAAAMLEKLRSERLKLVSVMARLPTTGFWERLLAPPYVFFFKLLYPFARVNQPESPTAAAAGGCVLLETAVLRRVGGFRAIRDALIDDCALAARVKRAGYPMWLGLSKAVVSQRGYRGVGDVWAVVSRSAYTQLDHSPLKLFAATALMLLMFLVPLLALPYSPWPMVCAILALGAMAVVYLPTVRFYELPLAWALTLPGAALLFLAMTWHSAWRYWRGTRAVWKNRIYRVAD